jgi:hypothetical protein
MEEANMPYKEMPQQQQTNTFAFLKSAATPQHGRKADAKIEKVKDKRSVTPTPGH